MVRAPGTRVRVATPVSQLFADPSDAARIAQVSHVLELRDHQPPPPGGVELLYHCEQSLVMPLDLDHVAHVLRAHDRRICLVSFHALSCYAEPGIQHGVFVPGEGRRSRNEMLRTCADNVGALRARFGNDVRLAVENNNYFPTGAYDDVTDPDFLSELVRGSSLGFLFDLAHARISAHNLGVAAETYAQRLPLERAVQLHISGYSLEGPTACDAHARLSEAQWDEVATVLGVLPAVEFVTLEYYGDPAVLLCDLRRLRRVTQYGLVPASKLPDCRQT